LIPSDIALEPQDPPALISGDTHNRKVDLSPSKLVTQIIEPFPDLVPSGEEFLRKAVVYDDRSFLFSLVIKNPSHAYAGSDPARAAVRSEGLLPILLGIGTTCTFQTSRRQDWNC
jgi:hypothetical protein